MVMRKIKSHCSLRRCTALALTILYMVFVRCSYVSDMLSWTGVKSLRTVALYDVFINDVLRVIFVLL